MVVCDVVYRQKYMPKKYKGHVAIYVKNFMFYFLSSCPMSTEGHGFIDLLNAYHFESALPFDRMVSICPQLDHDSCKTLDIYT